MCRFCSPDAWKRSGADHDAVAADVTQFRAHAHVDGIARLKPIEQVGFDLNDVFQLALFGRLPTDVHTDRGNCRQQDVMHPKCPPNTLRVRASDKGLSYPDARAGVKRVSFGANREGDRTWGPSRIGMNKGAGTGRVPRCCHA